METGGVSVRKERQSRAVPAHHAGAQRKRLIFLWCNLAFPFHRLSAIKVIAVVSQNVGQKFTEVH